MAAAPPLSTRVEVGGRPLAVLILTLGLLLGCRASPSPSPEITVPTIVGVVETREFTTPSTARFTLATGDEIELDLENARRLRGRDSPEPDIGWLLLYGQDSKGSWFLALSEQGEGRFPLQAHGRPAGDFVTFDFGLRLPIAEHWTQGPGAFEPGASPVWFVNERGEVIEIPT